MLAETFGKGFDGSKLASTQDAGLQLFEARKMPAKGKPEAGLLIFHGFGIHSGYYAELATHLCGKLPIAVHCLDMPSQGKSDDIEGLRGYIRSARDNTLEMVAALRRLIEVVKENGPIFLLGESYGGFVLLLTMLSAEYKEFANRVKGVVLCASLVLVPTAVLPPAPIVFLIKHLGGFFPKLVVPGEKVSETWGDAWGDKEYASFSKTDPLNLYGAPFYFSTAIANLKAFDEVKAGLDSLVFQNLLIMHYEGDTRVSITGVETLKEKAKVTGELKFVRLPANFHQVFQDVEEKRKENLSTVEEFLKKVMASA